MPRPRLVAFDLDDTLAPSKSPLSPEIAGLLVDLLSVAQVCVISGGQFSQFRDQVIGRLPAADEDALERMHLMPTCGTQYWRRIDGGWHEQYAENLTDAEKHAAMTVVEEEARRLDLWESEPFGEILEDRGSQITFSALGQQAPPDVKKAWDPSGFKRNSLRAAAQERLPELEVRSGGSTSIDITRRGIDKAYGMNKLAQLTGIPFGEMLFVGDRLDPDGNDFPVVALGIPTAATTGEELTAEIIRGLLTPDTVEDAEA